MRSFSPSTSFQGLLVISSLLLSTSAFAAQPTIKELMAQGAVTRTVVDTSRRGKNVATSLQRHSADGSVVSADKNFVTVTKVPFAPHDASALRKTITTERTTGTRSNGKGTATYTDFNIPLEWFSPASAYPDYTEPLFTQYRQNGILTGLGIYSDGDYQFGYWGSDFTELADSVSGVAGNADLDLIVEIEGFDQIGSDFNNIKYYPTLRTRMNVYGFSNAGLNAAGPSTLGNSKDLALPFDGELMTKSDLMRAHAYNDCYVNFGGFSVYADDIYTVSFDFLDFDPNSDKNVEYIVRSVTIRAYWY